MPVLENPKHEAFAAFVAEGLSAAEAYRKISPKVKSETAETNGPKLLRSAQVALRVEEMKAVQKEILETKFSISRQSICAYLIEVIETPIGKIDENHRLCQEYSETPNQSGTAFKYKMPAKLDAVEKIIKMAGFYAPEKVEHSASGPLVGMLARLTGAKKS